MGMFTTVIDPVTKSSHQIKCGWDQCEVYRLGDKVKSHIISEVAGSGYLLDDVYLAYSRDHHHEHAWIVIKDSTVVAIEDYTNDLNEENDDHTRLYDKYQIKETPREAWSEEAWQIKEELEAKVKKEYDEFKDSIAHLSPHEQFIAMMVKPLKDRLNYTSVARQMFKIEPLPNPINRKIFYLDESENE